MFLGIALLLAGALLTWLVSGILGGLCLLAGVIRIGMSLLNEEPEVEPRVYESGARTYELKSSYKPKP